MISWLPQTVQTKAQQQKKRAKQSLSPSEHGLERRLVDVGPLAAVHCARIAAHVLLQHAELGLGDRQAAQLADVAAARVERPVATVTERALDRGAARRRSGRRRRRDRKRAVGRELERGGVVVRRVVDLHAAGAGGGPARVAELERERRAEQRLGGAGPRAQVARVEQRRRQRRVVAALDEPRADNLERQRVARRVVAAGAVDRIELFERIHWEDWMETIGLRRDEETIAMITYKQQ